MSVNDYIRSSLIRVTPGEGDPGEYVKVGGTVYVPSVHALAEKLKTNEDKGIPVDATNCHTLPKQPDYQKTLAAVLGGKQVDPGAIVSAAGAAAVKAAGAVAAEAPVNPQRRATTTPRQKRKSAQFTADSASSADPVVWNTEYGDFSAVYHQVIVGAACMILVIGPESGNVFIPKVATKSTPLVYHLEFKGRRYKGMYLGMDAVSPEGFRYLVMSTQVEPS